METIIGFFSNPEAMAILIGAVLLFERIGKLIPDDATGAFAILRKISKLAGLYVSNRKDATDGT